MVRSFSELKKRWDDDVSCRQYHPGIVIKDAGLVLGADTILVRWARRVPARRPPCGRSRSGTVADSARCFIWAPGSARCCQEYRKCIGTVAARRKGFGAYSFGFHGLASPRKHKRCLSSLFGRSAPRRRLPAAQNAQRTRPRPDDAPNCQI
jgi:hypothetical protein